MLMSVKVLWSLMNSYLLTKSGLTYSTFLFLHLIWCTWINVAAEGAVL